MAIFDILEYNYDCADETINFGTRCMADGYNLYEATTRLTLKCSDETENPCSPHINALINCGRLYMSLNNILKIFDKECSKLLFEAVFDPIIDCLCVSQCARFLVIGLRDGSVQILSWKDEEYEVVSSGILLENESLDSLLFLNCFSQGEELFYVVATNGKIFSVNIFGEQNSVQSSEIFDCNFTIKAACCGYPLLLVDGAKLVLFDLENDTKISGQPCSFKRIFHVDYKLFVGLDHEGNLLEISCDTLLVCPLDATDLLLKEALGLSDVNNNLLQIVCLASQDSEPKLKMMSYPDLTEIYSLKAPQEISFVVPEFLHDEIQYISYIRNDKQSVVEVRVHMVFETDPEQRLERLLRKKQYEEAESFVRVFNLNPEKVSIAKASVLVEKSSCDADEITALLQLLDTISEGVFKLECCKNVGATDLNDVKRVLNYACNVVPKGHKADSPIFDYKLRELSDLMFKFDTFMVVKQESGFRMDWDQFSCCDLMDELKSYLSSNRVAEATILYSRLKESPTPQDIEEILGILNNLPIKCYKPFLPTFIPRTMLFLPVALPVLVDWVLGRMCSLEKRGGVAFPGNAVDFVGLTTRLIKVKNIHRVQYRQKFDELFSFISALETVQMLNEQYCVQTSVRDFLAGPHIFVRTLLITKTTNADNYLLLLQDFLTDFLLKNHLDPNKTFLDEISELLTFDEQDWICLVPTIISCISCTTTKLEAVHRVLQTAKVPWCAQVKSLADEVLQYSHPLVAQIKILIEDYPTQVVLQRPQYKIKLRRIVNLSDVRFVVRKIFLKKGPTMIDDIFQLCGNCPKQKEEALRILLLQLINEGDLNAALSVLDRNSPGERKKLCKYLISFDTLNARGQPQHKQNMQNILPSILRRLIDESECRFETSSHIEALERIEVVSSNDHLVDVCDTKDSVEQLLQTLFDEFIGDLITLADVLECCLKLPALSSESFEDSFIRFCGKFEDVDTLVKIGQHLLDTNAPHCSPKLLSSIVSLILKRVGARDFEEDISFNDTTCQLVASPVMENGDGGSPSSCCRGLQLCAELGSLALLRAGGSDILQTMEVLRWVHTSFYLRSNKSGAFQKVLFGKVNDCLSAGFLTYQAMNTVFNLFVRFVGQFKDPVHEFLNPLPDDDESLSEEQFRIQLKTNLRESVINMSKEDQHATSYSLISTLLTSLAVLPLQTSTILTCVHNALHNQCLPNLIEASFASCDLNPHLIFNLLLQCSSVNATRHTQTALKMYKTIPVKMTVIARIGIAVFELLRIEEPIPVIRLCILGAKWWMRFEKKLNYKDYKSFFKVDAVERLQMLSKAGCIEDLATLDEFCADFDGISNWYRTFYLNNLLSNWRPNYEIRREPKTGENDVVVKNNEDWLFAKCVEVTRLLSVEDVLNVVNSLWTKVNFYHYEVFITILKLKKMLEQPQNSDFKAKQHLLLFLRRYNRTSKPGATEMEYWYTAFPDTSSLDPLSQYRLPFIPSLMVSDGIWQIIKPEINLRTYKQWFEAGALVKNLNKDDICRYAINEIVADGILGRADNKEKWALYPKQEELMSQVKECAGHITNLENATAALYHLLINTSPGADLVNVAKMCYEFAELYTKSNPDSVEVERAFLKVKYKFYNYSAIHILHLHQLADEKYTNLVNSPSDLIVSLYKDPRILHQSVFLPCPDINKATDALAELFDKNIKNLRLGLIENWLVEYTTESIEFGKTFTTTQSTSEDALVSEDDLVTRATYICAGDPKYWCDFLLQVGVGREYEDKKNLRCKARALQVIAAISDADHIQSIMGLNWEEFMLYIDELKIANNLFYLGFNMDLETLHAQDKKTLINQVAHKARNQIGVKTLGLLCMAYRFYDAKYWDFLIKSTIKCSMFAELKKFLAFIREDEQRRLENRSVFINGWQKLLEHEISSIISSAYEDGVKNDLLVEQFLVIQSCPVLFTLNFENIFNKCLEVGKTDFSAILIQYVQGDKRREWINIINNQEPQIGARIDKLSDGGLTGGSYVQGLLAS